jgi:hypothetical protein
MLSAPPSALKMIPSTSLRSVVTLPTSRKTVIGSKMVVMAIVYPFADLPQGRRALVSPRPPTALPAADRGLGVGGTAGSSRCHRPLQDVTAVQVRITCKRGSAAPRTNRIANVKCLKHSLRGFEIALARTWSDGRWSFLTRLGEGKAEKPRPK